MNSNKHMFQFRLTHTLTHGLKNCYNLFLRTVVRAWEILIKNEMENWCATNVDKVACASGSISFLMNAALLI